jgi:hypothetical protein
VDENAIEVSFTVEEWMPASELVEMLRREQEQVEPPEPSESQDDES